jgi:16S rRNA processing protein RimM
MTAKPALILVGRISGAFGVKGELRLSSYTEDPMALARYRVLLREDGAKALTVASAREVKDGLIVRAPEVADRTAAEGLRGLRLYIPRDALPPPEEDEYYLADLIGLAAVTVDGAPAGRIKAVHDFGAGDLLELDPGDGRPTVLVPFTKEAVPEVSLAEGRVVVNPPVEDNSSPPPDGDGPGIAKRDGA